MSKDNRIRVFQYCDGKGGSAFWRMIWHGYQLNLEEKIKVIQNDVISKNIMDYAITSVVYVQKKSLSSHLRLLKKLHSLKDRFRFRLIFEADDALDLDVVPKYNQAYKKLEEVVKDWRLKEVTDLCDEMTVTTHALRDYYLETTNQKNITVIPNYPPYHWIGHMYDEELLRRNYRRHRSRPRILYAGSASHFETAVMKLDDIVDDFTPVKDAVLKSIMKFQWVFVGAIPQALVPFRDKGIVEFHQWKPMNEYPKFLASLNVNMCIAPLLDNTFNRCKSDLKFLEASALGLPIACQNMCTYAIAPIKFNTGEEMLDRINETLSTEDSYIRASRECIRLVQSRWLENKENIGKYKQLYSFPYGDHRRTLL